MKNNIFICALFFFSVPYIYANPISDNIKHIRELSKTFEYHEYDNKLIKRTITVKNIGIMPYSIYLPPLYDSDSNKKWPLILFLHGSWETGRDGKRQSLRGIGEILMAHAQKYPAVVLMPQTPHPFTWGMKVVEDATITILNLTLDEFNIDRERLYLTGLSLGGTGVLSLAISHPDIFSAVAPICPGYPFYHSPRLVAESLLHQNIRIFHGDKDPVWPYIDSKLLVERLNKSRVNDDKKWSADLITYENANHFIWERAYTDERFYQWLFSQRKIP